ncbi:MAG: transposase [Bdellovibrionaceae bacterium]|nr:transposase [Pseudobdellovibrionaceae bacterium]
MLKALPDGDHNSTSGLVAKNSGFSLHAGVATKAQEREKLEKICRYIARPALSEERLSTNVRGEIIYRLKKPWSDGTLAVKFTPMEFMERLAALISRPKIHLTRYHGVLAPHYKFRKQIVKQVVSIGSKAKIDSLNSRASNDKKSHAKKSNRIRWANLLKRVFDIDITICPKCRGKVRIISAIEDPAVISKILNHLGLPSTPPRLHPARGPPDSEQSDLFSQDFPDY